MRRRWFVVIAGVASVASGTWAAAALIPDAWPQPGHTPFHIGCKNHKHGPKWQDAQISRLRGKRIAASAAGGSAAPTLPLAARSLTAGHPGL